MHPGPRTGPDRTRPGSPDPKSRPHSATEQRNAAKVAAAGSASGWCVSRRVCVYVGERWLLYAPFFVEHLHECRDAADVVEVFEDVLAAGLEVCDKRGGVADALEVVERDINANGACHRD